MKEVLERTFKRAVALLASGEALVELGEMQQ
jgi:hypothetical protein